MDNPRSILRAQLMAVSPRGVVVHGAALALGSRSLVFLAPSGGGKTTTAMDLERLGWRRIGDDSVVVVRGTDGVHRTLPCGAQRMRTGDRGIEPAELAGWVFLEKGPCLLLPVPSRYGSYRAERIGSLMAFDMVPLKVQGDSLDCLETLFHRFPSVIHRRRPEEDDRLLRSWLLSL